MIRIEPISGEQWLVTVSGKTKTQHRVSVSAAEVQRYGRGSASPPELLDASFRFLLEREPNTAIMSAFELSVISRYFPEYEDEIAKYFR